MGNLLFMLLGRTSVQSWNTPATARIASSGSAPEAEDGEDREPLMGA